MAAHQQVGSFEVVNKFGVLQKNGGNVASYFCTPDGRVVNAVTGPVPPAELLDAAHWAVETYERTEGDPARISQAHRDAIVPGFRRVAGRLNEIHTLLADPPLPPLGDVYRPIFEDILGQRVSKPETDISQAETAFATAQRAKLPLLLILHKNKDNASVLQEWDNLLAARGGGAGGAGLATLGRSYVVVALPLKELPALSGQMHIPPYAAPDGGSPLCVIARSNGHQLAAVTTWNKTDELTYALAKGLVQEAKEHDRSPKQLQTLLGQVRPVDDGLGRDVLSLQVDAKGSRPTARRRP